MGTRKFLIVRVGMAAIFAACTLFAATGIFGQTVVDLEVPPPKEERFVAADGLLFPASAVEITCGVTSLKKRPDCPPDRGRSEQHILEIQDNDRSLWYRFSIYRLDPAYFIDFETRELVNSDFKPLGPALWYPLASSFGKVYLDKTQNPGFPNQVVLRLVGESPNWYEVEVNDETRLKKYISKHDPLWVRIGWPELFGMNYGQWIVIDTTRTDVLDKPNGKPIDPPCGKIEYKRLFFSSLDGEWMEVNRGRNVCHGWVRWRDGREILVGSRLNGFEVVERQNEEK